MENKQKIYINNTQYIIELISSRHSGALNQVYDMLFRFYTSDEQDCKTIIVSITELVERMWQSNSSTQLAPISYESFAWQVIPLFIQRVDKDSLRIFIYRDEMKEEKKITVYIKAKKSIADTARSIIFQTSNPSNSLIRREILKICYNKWQIEPHGFVGKIELLKFVPVSDVELERNIKYLVEGYYLKGSLTTAGYVYTTITRQGIDVYENPEEFNRLFSIKIEQQTYNVGGDLITSVIVGDKNKASIKSREEVHTSIS